MENKEHIRKLTLIMLFTTRKTLLNISSTLLQRSIATVATFFSVPMIAKNFGGETLGLWLLVIQISRFTSILNLGLNTSLVRFIAGFIAVKDSKAISEYFSIIFLLLVSMAIIIIATLCVFLGLAFFMDVEFGELRPNEIVAIAIGVVFASISLPLQTAHGLLASRNSFDHIANAGTLAHVTWMCCLLFMLWNGVSSIIPIIWAYFLIFFLKDVVLFSVGYNAANRPPISYSIVSAEAFFAVSSVSIAAFLLTLSVSLLRQGGSFFASGVVGMNAVVLISLPLQAVYGISLCTSIGGNLIVPISSAKAKLGDKQLLEQTTIIAARYTFYVTMSILLTFLFFGDDIFGLWLKNSLPSATISQVSEYFLVLFTCFVLMSPAHVFRSVLVTVGLHWQVTRAEVIFNVVGFLIGVLFLFFTDIAEAGVIGGICIAFILRAFGKNLSGIKGYFGWSNYNVFQQIYMKPLLIGVLLMFIHFCSVFINLIMPYQILVDLVLLILLVPLGSFVLHQKHRQLLFSKIRRIFPHNA